MSLLEILSLSLSVYFWLHALYCTLLYLYLLLLYMLTNLVVIKLILFVIPTFKVYLTIFQAESYLLHCGYGKMNILITMIMKQFLKLFNRNGKLTKELIQSFTSLKSSSFQQNWLKGRSYNAGSSLYFFHTCFRGLFNEFYFFLLGTRYECKDFSYWDVFHPTRSH